MSYEGYVEKLCSNGHLSSVDAHDDYEEDKCHRCKKPFVFIHHVDQTNGIEEDENGEPHPYTVGYPFEKDGFDDEVYVDHYDNKYFVKILRYKIPKKK